MKTPEVGDMVCVVRRKLDAPGVKGFDSFPGIYGFHRAVWVAPGLGIVTEKSDTFARVLIHGVQVWFEDHQLLEPGK